MNRSSVVRSAYNVNPYGGWNLYGQSSRRPLPYPHLFDAGPKVPRGAPEWLLDGFSVGASESASVIPFPDGCIPPNSQRACLRDTGDGKGGYAGCCENMGAIHCYPSEKANQQAARSGDNMDGDEGTFLRCQANPYDPPGGPPCKTPDETGCTPSPPPSPPAPIPGPPAPIPGPPAPISGPPAAPPCHVNKVQTCLDEGGGKDGCNKAYMNNNGSNVNCEWLLGYCIPKKTKCS